MTKRVEVNPIDVVEAAYDLDADDKRWLDKLAQLVGPLFAGRAGGSALVLDAALLHKLADSHPTDVRARKLWTHLNPHITAGHRLRTAHEGSGTPRDSLCNAVLRAAALRNKGKRRNGASPNEVWNALVTGAWSLVCRFDSGGRRYIVARRNPPSRPDPRALTSRERLVSESAALGKPNKLIGYELGLSESTVGSHLSSAMRKLGVRSRVDLIQLAQLGLVKK